MKDAGGVICGYVIIMMYEAFRQTWLHTPVIPALVKQRQGGVRVGRATPGNMRLSKKKMSSPFCVCWGVASIRSHACKSVAYRGAGYKGCWPEMDLWVSLGRRREPIPRILPFDLYAHAEARASPSNK